MNRMFWDNCRREAHDDQTGKRFLFGQMFYLNYLYFLIVLGDEIEFILINLFEMYWLSSQC
ncbi:hypothetical protein LEP1GSC202_0472 [Leptospira yanagawae serovar Saopaulo str. Sao Paulo = ATCC 700523]|uniref:Uncharacterized protein n=1 Tax=Leptospira yanagawae serovar Saopaulo str. Sao Paulo = ATCC 700523 TaxID=1249483 RepID=A0A5E8HG75_9LEPT|nr:hypothetical protein LEP1GSC202_0472 [Leptospira yanagawae serovar Saopaulo str. Sao Paulo = ATCC 700523]